MNTYGLDTNIVVRLLMQDDPEQSARASAIFDELTPTRKGFICQIVQAEIWWVLRRSYKLTAAQAAAALQGLLDSDNIAMEQPQALAWALDRAAQGADLADALIVQASSKHAHRVVTFDKQAADRGFGLEYALPPSATPA